MTTYNETKGTKIQVLATDPSETIEGQVWYNSTSNTLKIFKTFFDAWSTGGNLATARNSLAGAGTQTAGLAFGGRVPAITVATEEYDGSAWTSGGNMGTARGDLGGTGTQTAGLAFGGSIPAATTLTEEYDGSAWTGGGNLTTSKRGGASAGTQTAGLFSGGRPPGNPGSNNTQEYNGTTWTNGGTLNVARQKLAGCGATNTAALAFGGEEDFNDESISTEEYDGSTWTTGGNLNTFRELLAGAGTQTAGLAFGGSDGLPGGGANKTITALEKYDGTSWTAADASLSTGRNSLAGAGTPTAALAFGGSPGALANTEEYNGAPFIAAATVTQL